MKIIPTKVHGVIDYLMVILLLALPRLLGWNGTVTLILTILAIGILVYSLITRYELSLFKLIPMPVHLILDGLGGLVLLGTALLVPNLVTSEIIVLIILAAGELVVTFLTQTAPREIPRAVEAKG